MAINLQNLRMLIALKRLRRKTFITTTIWRWSAPWSRGTPGANSPLTTSSSCRNPPRSRTKCCSSRWQRMELARASRTCITFHFYEITNEAQVRTRHSIMTKSSITMLYNCWSRPWAPEPPSIVTLPLLQPALLQPGEQNKQPGNPLSVLQIFLL